MHLGVNALVTLAFLDVLLSFGFFFQAEDGIRDAQESRGLGDVYKRQFLGYAVTVCDARPVFATATRFPEADEVVVKWPHKLSLIHI